MFISRSSCHRLALLCLLAMLVGRDASAEDRGTLLYEYWSGISGNSLSALTADPRFPNTPSGQSYLTAFEAPSNRGDNYGARLRAYLYPSQSGDYRFLIAGDDTCELWLSSSTDPLQKRLIASVPSYTNAREWTRYPQQQSAVVTLTAGASYYIEARHKEGAGLDHLAVAWTGPGIGETPTVIAGEYLSPSEITNPVIPPSAGTGSLTVQTWQGLSGNTLSALTGVTWYPLAPTTTGTLTSFATPANGSDNYGQRVRGFICPNITGTYRLWIASDDQSELLLSTSENPAHAVRIASVTSYTGSLQWDRFPEQKSAEVLLTGGLRYYVEVRHKEGVGGDHLAVAWEGPSQARAVIAGANLAPWPVPIISGQTVFSQSTTVTINATVPTATIVYTTDGTVPTASSPRYEAPFALSTSAVVTAAIIAADGTVGEPTQGVFRKPGSGSGLAAGYYANENLVGTPIQRIDPVINFDWGTNAPLANFTANNFSVRWQGEIETTLPEAYSLIARTDDGVRVWIDGVLVINDWSYRGARDLSCVLPPGRHTLDIEYKEGTGYASAQVFWTSEHTGREIVPSTQLHPLLGVRGVIPPTSPVSPVYLEISHLMEVTPTATVAGVATPMCHLDDVVHYLNAPLTPDQPTVVSVSGGTGAPLTGQITWTPTVITGHAATVIRAGDSLLLNFPQAGNLTITTYSGTYLPTQTVTEGQLKPVRFTVGGIHIVRLTTPDGIEVATLDVTVVSADLSGVILSEVGYTRAVNVAIAPVNAPVTFLGNSQLSVVTDSIAQNLADLRITPQRRGTPRLQARINGPYGPLIAEQAIDEFTIDQTALRSAVINASTNIGTATLVMRPFIPNQRFTMSMFAHAATFAGGARNLTIDTNGAPASNGEAPMAQQWDVTTNELIGVFRFDLEVPENESKYCFRVARQQIPTQPQAGAYLPTTTGGSMLSQAGLLAASYNLLMGTYPEKPENGPMTNVNGDACHVSAFTSLVFTKADEIAEDYADVEVWQSRQWSLLTSDYCTKGQMGDGNCNAVTYLLKVSDPPAFNGRLDVKLAALFGGSKNTSDCKACSGTCGPVTPVMDSGTIPGKYTTQVQVCATGSGDTVGSATGGTFYVSKLDAHGAGSTAATVKAFVETLPKRRGTLSAPVIQMNSGGDGSLAGCSLYGWAGTRCPAKNTWSFTAIARDPEAATVDPQSTSVRPEGYTIKWTNIPGGDQTSETITVEFPVGRHFPRLEVWYSNPDEPEELREPHIVGVAEIHSIVVEEFPAANCARANAAVTLPGDHCPGTEFFLTNNVDGSTMVDARLSLVGLPAFLTVRGRVSLDGYPQNEYWVLNEGDALDLPQVVGVPDGETQKYFVQGYGTASPERAPNAKLRVEGQALYETCDVVCNLFKNSPVVPQWELTDEEQFRVTADDGEWSGEQNVTVPLQTTRNILAQFTNISSCRKTFIFKNYQINRLVQTFGLSLEVLPLFDLEKDLDSEELQEFTNIAKNLNDAAKPPPIQQVGFNGIVPRPGEIWDWVIRTDLIAVVILKEETTGKEHTVNISAESWVWAKVGDGVFDPPTERDGYKNPQSYTSDGRYRGVDLYGIPKSDASPTGEGENDQVPDETTIDMMNLSPTYTRTDISLPCEGGELAIQLRRTGGIRSLDVTMDSRRVAGRIALPNQVLTGHGWSTNLGAQVALDLISFSGNLNATVTDELGESLKYEWSGVNQNGATFTPVSVADGGDHRAMKAKLETLASDDQGRPIALRLTKRFGTKVEYEFAGDYASTDGKSQKRICRIARVVDRNGNAVIYTYRDAYDTPGNENPDHRLLVASMHEEGHPERRLTFSYDKLYANQLELDTGWRLTGVTDPSGRTITYEYENYGSNTNVPYVWIGSPLAPVPGTFAPANCALLARVIRPPNVVDGADSTRPITRFTYRMGDVTPRYYTVQGEIGATPVTRFIAPKRITDARDHVTEFIYDYEEFPTIRNFDPPQANLCLRSITTNAGTMFVTTAERSRGTIRTQAVSTDLTVTDYAFTLEPENPFYSLGDILLKCERKIMVAGVPKVSIYEYGRNLFGNIVKVTDINENVITYDYDNGDPTDPANKPVGAALYSGSPEDTPNTYQLLGMPCKRTVGPGGLNLVTHYRRDTTFRALIKEIDAEGIVTRHVLDGHGNRTSIIEADGTAVQRATSFVYASDGFMTATVDPDLRRTEFERTFSGALVTAATADRTSYRTVVTKRFPSPGQVVTATSVENLYGDKLAAIDGKGNRTDFIYDPHHRVIVSLSAATEIPVRSNAYVGGTPASVRHALPSDLANADLPANGMVRARSDAFYDLNGNAVRQVDENGHVTVMTYDYHNRPLTVRRRMVEATADHADDIVTSTSYTPRGQVLRTTDARDNYTETTYDELSRPIRQDLPPLTPGGARLAQQFFYGQNSGAGTWTVRSGWQATRVIDARNVATDTTYDGIYRPIRVVRRHGIPPPDELAAPGDLDQVSETTYNRMHKVVRALMRDEDSRWRATLTYYDRFYRVSATVVTYGDHATLSRPELVSGFRDDGFALHAGLFSGPDYNLDVRIFASRYDQAGNVVQSRDASQRVTDKTYDLAGRLTTTVAPAVEDAEHGYALVRPMTRLFYDGNSSPEIAQDARGTQSKSFYDARNRVTRSITDLDGDGLFETNGEDIAVSSAYDLANQVVQSTDPRGFTTDQYRDAAGRVVNTEMPAVANAEAGGVLQRPSIRTVYDANGNAVTMRDARSVVTQTTFDAYNRPVQVQAAMGSVDAVTTTTAYDANGNALSLTLMNGTQPQTTTYAYDSFNRKVSELLPNNGDGIVRETTWQYTVVNEPRLKREPAGNEIVTSYDGFGQVSGTSITAVGSQLSRSMTYTQNGKLESVSESESRAGVALRARTTSYTYDQLDRVTSEVFVSDNEPSHHVHSGYDLNGNRVIAVADVVATPAMPATTRETWSIFDRANRVVTIADTGRPLPGGGFATTTYGYDLAGNRLSVQRPDGIVDASSYDALNRVQQATTTGPGQALGNLYQVSYTYDLVGNRRTATESTAGLGSRALVYVYDQQYRLTEEAETTATRSRSTSWQYDLAGNRTQQVQTLTETPPAPAVALSRTTTTEYVVDVLNRLMSWTATTVETSDGITGFPSTLQCQYGYDANGNQIEDTQTLTSNPDATPVVNKRQRFQWDCLNRLIAVTDLLPASETTIFTAEYDARTRRRLTQEGATTTQFRYDGGDAYQEHTPTGPTAFFARGSSMGGGIGGVLYSDRRSASGSIETFVYNPAVGHTVGTVGTDAQIVSANSYDAFGQVIDRIGMSANNRLANTKERSASIGLDNHGFRYYNPVTGRYISRDPIGYGDGMNVYLYVHCNPINFIDPLGLIASVRERLADNEEFREQYQKAHDAQKLVDKYKNAGWRTPEGVAYRRAKANLTAAQAAMGEMIKTAKAEFMVEATMEQNGGELTLRGMLGSALLISGIAGFAENLDDAFHDTTIYGEEQTTSERVWKGVAGAAEIGMCFLPAVRLLGKAAPATQVTGKIAPGLARKMKFGHNWREASIDDAIRRHAGDNYTTWVTKTNKRIYEDPRTGRQIVEDLDGGYFRIFQPKTIGADKGTYLDMMGRAVNNTDQGNIMSHFIVGK